LGEAWYDLTRIPIHDMQYTKTIAHMENETPARTWTFVTNHTQVLLCIARDPGVRLRDVAARVGITERAVQRIVAELVEAGFVERRRVGRRNEYSVNREGAMRHPAQFGHEVGELLDLLKSPGARAA
jgi:DNA-binding MarR family transcriptional regulator